MTEPNYRKRPCDIETESFRCWIPSKEEEVEPSEGDISVPYKDYTFKICGFNQVLNKDKKVVFAYKIKDEDNVLLYYIPEGNTEEDLKNVNEFFEFTDTVGKYLGYNRQNVMDTLKSIYEQKESITKLGDMKHV